MAWTWPLRGLTETREGRLAIIIVVGGVLVVGLRLADVIAAHKADDAAADIRRSLRAELRPLSDDELAAFDADEVDTTGPDTDRDGGSEIETAARRALADQPAQLLAIGATEDTAPPLVLIVETGWAWQARCIRAELRGHNTVLTEVRRSHC